MLTLADRFSNMLRFIEILKQPAADQSESRWDVTIRQILFVYTTHIVQRNSMTSSFCQLITEEDDMNQQPPVTNIWTVTSFIYLLDK